MNTKNAFSAAQNRSKRTGGAAASNATNATTAANVLMAASACKTTSFGQLIAQANKRLRKGVPLIVANHAVSAMGSGNNQVTLISDSAETALPEMGKRDTADAIVAEIARLLEKAT